LLFINESKDTYCSPITEEEFDVDQQIKIKHKRMGSANKGCEFAFVFEWTTAASALYEHTDSDDMQPHAEVIVMIRDIAE
jgi:hypothetical protein